MIAYRVFGGYYFGVAGAAGQRIGPSSDHRPGDRIAGVYATTNPAMVAALVKIDQSMNWGYDPYGNYEYELPPRPPLVAVIAVTSSYVPSYKTGRRGTKNQNCDRDEIVVMAGTVLKVIPAEQFAATTSAGEAQE